MHDAPHDAQAMEKRPIGLTAVLSTSRLQDGGGPGQPHQIFRAADTWGYRVAVGCQDSTAGL